MAQQFPTQNIFSPFTNQGQNRFGALAGSGGLGVSRNQQVQQQPGLAEQVSPFQRFGQAFQQRTAPGGVLNVAAPLPPVSPQRFAAGQEPFSLSQPPPPRDPNFVSGPLAVLPPVSPLARPGPTGTPGQGGSPNPQGFRGGEPIGTQLPPGFIPTSQPFRPPNLTIPQDTSVPTSMARPPPNLPPPSFAPIRPGAFRGGDPIMREAPPGSVGQPPADPRFLKRVQDAPNTLRAQYQQFLAAGGQLSFQQWLAQRGNQQPNLQRPQLQQLGGLAANIG